MNIRTFPYGMVLVALRTFRPQPAAASLRLAPVKVLDKYIMYRTNPPVDISSRGPMDKASDYGSEDSRFDSWRGRHFGLVQADLMIDQVTQISICSRRVLSG